jgi:small subunit ribosomal protein S20
MPTHKAAYKSIRKDKKRNLRNKRAISELKTLFKNLDSMISEKNPDAKALFQKVKSKLSKAASKGIIHKNVASRKISRLSKKISRISS